MRDLLAQVVQRCEEGNRIPQEITVLSPRNIASEPTPQPSRICLAMRTLMTFTEC